MTENPLPSLTLHLGQLPWIDRSDLAEGFSSLQEVIFQDTGVLIPTLRIQEDPELAENAFWLKSNKLTLEPATAIGADEFWLNLGLEDLEGEEWSGRIWHARESINPDHGTPAAIVEGDEQARQLWAQEGYDTRTPTGYVVYVTAAELRKHPAELLHPFVVEHYLARLDEHVPALVQVVRERFDVPTLYQHLLAVLASGDSIRDLPAILEQLMIEKMD